MARGAGLRPAATARGTRAMVVPTGRLPHWTAVGKGIEGVHGLTVVKQVSRWSRRRVNARLEARYMREAHAAQWWARPAP